MVWHIAKREILDNLTRFRFALTVTLVMVLMVMNAVIFVSSKYQRRIAAYSQDTKDAIALMKARSSSLSELGIKGRRASLQKTESIRVYSNRRRREFAEAGHWKCRFWRKLASP